jgi:HSP20 family protein
MNWPSGSFTGSLGVTPSLWTRLNTSFSHSSLAVDVTEKDGTFVVSAEMPGLAEKDIQVSLSGDMLTIKGEKRLACEEKGKNRYLSERSYGDFQRVFSLPDGVDRASITASFDNGVLTVTLPKSAKTTLRKIEITAAA